MQPLNYQQNIRCDLGGIQTHDLQNRNLTLYSLSYQTETMQKYILSSTIPKVVKPYSGQMHLIYIEKSSRYRLDTFALMSYYYASDYLKAFGC